MLILVWLKKISLRGNLRLAKMSSKHKHKSCPECNGRMESVQIKEAKNGVIYSQKAVQCVECGYTDTIRNRKDRIPEELE